MVLKGIQLDIKRGEKIALSVRMEKVKSTLVKMIMNEIPFEGELKIGHHVNIGYFAQNQADLLDPGSFCPGYGRPGCRRGNP